jgi:hypothetical protein
MFLCRIPTTNYARTRGNRKTMITQQNNVFIDPQNCGSSVGYYIAVDEYKPKDKSTIYSVRASVVLTDCSHKIDWCFSADSVEKIDNAISMLQEFRKKYIEIEKTVSELNK